MDSGILCLLLVVCLSSVCEAANSVYSPKFIVRFPIVNKKKTLVEKITARTQGLEDTQGTILNNITQLAKLFDGLEEKVHTMEANQQVTDGTSYNQQVIDAIEVNMAELNKSYGDLQSELTDINATMKTILTRADGKDNKTAQMSQIIAILRKRLDDLEASQTGIADMKTRLDQLATALKVTSHTLDHAMKCMKSGYRFIPEVDMCIRWSSLTDVKDWFASEQTCKLEGGRLVNLDSVDKQNEVMKLFASLKITGYRFWVGLRKLNTPDNMTFKWTGGSDYVGQWDDINEPDTVGYQNVVQLLDHGLSDMQSDRMRQYICERLL